MSHLVMFRNTAKVAGRPLPTNPKMGTAGAPEGDRKQVAKQWKILNKTS